ncbi:MAG: ferrous iron transporter B [ANME-2 cluster archaeon]|nr:ferrous iron transporter B [ANME-2 cluster archaeon]MBC2702092.1 ferrous iron transporter B [ANME-2 cluster archaeon]MBC2706757.1 ferrous iron transporter B [ANME-2 cluster archaeon]MBC2747666.1 ferrous iron transporter B [ANME-2 cluster archaeon]MBC2762969.1 ferrous iron transporter B [ANME-2 cluster archaeon]
MDIQKVKKILLMGNPNVGKSVVFSRLTGANVIASNYPGSTIEFTKGLMRIEGSKEELIDVPGTYSLEPINAAEEVAVKMLDEGDLIINVIDSTNLERNLFLTLELLQGNTPVVVALNMWDEAKHNGITINPDELEKLLGVPVVPIVALTGEGIKKLLSRLKETHIPTDVSQSDAEKWIHIGEIIKKVQRIEHRHHTIWEKISDATVKPTTGLPIGLGVILLTFSFIRFIGEGLIGYVLEPLFDLYTPVAMEISSAIGPGIFHDIIIGRLIEGNIDYVQSMGLLTTGIFVPFGMVLPYILAFYFGLSILEDTGYLPRLSVLADTIFHKFGLHGCGIVSVFLGLGCNVPGALSTRILETRKQRFISATLMAISIPCMAQIAMIFGILGSYGIEYVLMVFIALIATYVSSGLLLNRYIAGESPELFLEIPPYRRPYGKALLKKTWMRVRIFLTEAIPFVFLGVLFINILYAVGIIETLGTFFSPVISGIWGLPKEAAAALLIGFLRKDMAIGMLLPLGMNPFQLVIAATVLTIYFPCVATFAVLVRELGIRDMAKSVLLMIAAALIVGGIMRLILLGF